MVRKWGKQTKERLGKLRLPSRIAWNSLLVLVLVPGLVACSGEGEAASVQTSSDDVAVTGELKLWHKVILTLEGPSTSATATPNPFLDLRFDVTFEHSESRTIYRVPGYFDADGDAANTSAHEGSKWRAILTPDHTGQWTYRTSFRQGSQVAVADSPTAGTALSPYDGITGSFTIGETDKTGSDFRSKGMLRYVNKHYLQFAGTGEWFLKVGSDSPENLLAYEDFDDTPDYRWEGRLGGGFRKSWEPHVGDWKPGDATWKDGRGKGLIGALNYLASKGLNSQSFLTYSVHGDDRNVSPYIDSEDRTRISVPKVNQWEIVFDHMEKLGLFMEFKMMEIENDWDHDAGQLGPERRLYYRELVARFGHHLGLNWNVGEENNNTPAMRMAFGKYIYETDPYDHLINIHNIGNWERLYRPLLGKESPYKGASLQINFYDVYDVTRYLRMASELVGEPWVITIDETRPGPAGAALGHVNAAVARDVADPDHNEARKGALWANIMAGGAGMNTYVGFGTDVGDPSTTTAKIDVPDLMLEDFRKYDLWWDQMRAAHSFFVDNKIPFQEMVDRNEVVSSGWALASPDMIVAYFPNGTLSGRIGASGGAAYGPRVPVERAGEPPRIPGFYRDENAPRQAPGAMGGLGAVGPNAGGDRHGQAPTAGPGTPADCPTLDLQTFQGDFEVLWFDPKNGGALQKGSVPRVSAGGDVVEIGRPPIDPERDWVVVLRR